MSSKINNLFCTSISVHSFVFDGRVKCAIRVNIRFPHTTECIKIARQISCPDFSLSISPFHSSQLKFCDGFYFKVQVLNRPQNHWVSKQTQNLHLNFANPFFIENINSSFTNLWWKVCLRHITNNEHWVKNEMHSAPVHQICLVFMHRNRT